MSHSGPHPILKIGKSSLKLGLMLLSGLFSLLLPLLLILAGAWREIPLVTLLLLPLVPVGWYLMLKPALRMARQPDPLITFGQKTLSFHHSGDVITYDRILAVRTLGSLSVLSILQLRLKSGPQVALRTHHIPLVSIRNPPEHLRWDLAQIGVFKMATDEIAAEIERRIPAAGGSH